MYSCCDLDLPLPPTGLPLYVENLPSGLVVLIVKILGIQFSKIPMNKS